MSSATSSSKAFRRVDPGMDPCDAAAWLWREDGFAFLDSALQNDNSISILGTRPDCVISGSASDWGRLASELERRERVGADHGLPSGAAIGWVAFDGSFRFGMYEDLLAYRHRDGCWFAYGDPILPAGGAVESGCGKVPEFRPTISAGDFCGMVEAAQEFIASGDIYQVCLAHRFTADWDPECGHAFYESLRHISPAPHAASINLGGTSVLSASPETFLRMSGSSVVTRPIKGTRPRKPRPEADQRSAYDLITSPKEIAELVMITDLERNDLGRIAEIGSVRVTDLLKLERFEQVFHLVSTVEAVMRKGVSHADVLAACFPGGSISGAPKKRALEIIDELEPCPRGLYTGAAGYFGFNGESQFNLLIRSVIAGNGSASFHVGAGIVADSNPRLEWLETLDKASGILAAAKALRRV